MKDKNLPQPILKLLDDHLFLCEDFYSQQNGIQLFGFTEYRHETLSFHCHPNYQNEGPWFDYVLIAWNQDGQDSESSDEDSMAKKLHNPVATENDVTTRNIKLIPAKLICFIKNHRNEM